MYTAQMASADSATMHGMKRCSKCRKMYPATVQYFHRNRGKLDGLNSYCRQCRAGYPCESGMECPLTAPAAPVVEADVLRLFAMIRRLHYGDCLTCGNWTLERHRCQIIRTTEDDSARDGTLVTDSYTDYLLYWCDSLVGVFDMRADRDTERISAIHRQIAVYLCERGWTASSTRRIEYGAVTPPDTRVTRVFRPLKKRHTEVQR